MFVALGLDLELACSAGGRSSRGPRLSTVLVSQAACVTLAATVTGVVFVDVCMSGLDGGPTVTGSRENARRGQGRGLIFLGNQGSACAHNSEPNSPIVSNEPPVRGRSFERLSLMSQTSTSHTQWIQHAVAAAKAGNPSVAKIQLQKAAEAAPGDPAVWLWMGWLADSPASAVQCLELARSDERFQKIADAGIDFAKALAEFQLELQEEVVVETWAEEPANDLVETSPVVSPVEAVEEVAAVVETLQQEDSAEPAIDSDSWERSTSNDDCESAISESVEQVSESGAATGEENDSTPDSPTDDSEADATVQPVVDASDDSRPESALDETVLAESDDSDLECDQPESAGSDKTNAVEAYASDAAPVAANDVESELITSANELWQTTENVADSEPGTPGSRLMSRDPVSNSGSQLRVRIGPPPFRTLLQHKLREPRHRPKYSWMSRMAISRLRRGKTLNSNVSFPFARSRSRATTTRILRQKTNLRINGWASRLITLPQHQSGEKLTRTGSVSMARPIRNLINPCQR